MRLMNWCIPISLLYGVSVSQTFNTLTADETQQGFKLLFDGTMQSVRDNFVAYQKDGVSVTTLPANIEVPAGKEYFWDNGATQDIRSKALYDDFELKFDYRISDNAGLYYRANVLTGAIYENSIEYPLYDGTPVPGNWNAPAAAYDIYAPTAMNYKQFATGEWNTVRIRLFKDSVYHWHNGVEVVKFSLASADFKTRLVARKWANVPCIAVEAATVSACDHNNPYRKTGYIGFQTGYPGQLLIRNLKLAKYPFPPVVSVNANAAAKTGFTAVPTAAHGLDIKVDVGEDFQLKVFSTDGKLAQWFQGGADANRFSYRAPVPGLYFIHLVSKSGSSVQKAMID
jgi:hypothetical protein